MSRLCNEIINLIEVEKDPELLKNSIEGCITFHNETAEERRDLELDRMAVYVARDILTNPPDMGTLGIWWTIKIWFNFLINPQGGISKICALSAIVFPRYLKRYKDEYKKKLENDGY